MEHDRERPRRSSPHRRTSSSSSRRPRTSPGPFTGNHAIFRDRHRLPSNDAEVSPRTIPVPPALPAPSAELHVEDSGDACGWPLIRPGELPLLWDPSLDGCTVLTRSTRLNERRHYGTGSRRSEARGTRLRTQSDERNTSTRQARRNSTTLEPTNLRNRASDARSQGHDRRRSECNEAAEVLVGYLISLASNMPEDVADRMRSVLAALRWALDDEALDQCFVETADEVWAERRRMGASTGTGGLRGEGRRVVEILEWRREGQQRDRLGDQAGAGSTVEQRRRARGDADDDEHLARIATANEGARNTATREQGSAATYQQQRLDSRELLTRVLRTLDREVSGLGNADNDRAVQGRALRAELAVTPVQVDADLAGFRPLSEQARGQAEDVVNDPRTAVLHSSTPRLERAMRGAEGGSNQFYADMDLDAPGPLSEDGQRWVQVLIDRGMVGEIASAIASQSWQDVDAVRSNQQCLSQGQREFGELHQRDRLSRQERRQQALQELQRRMSSRQGRGGRRHVRRTLLPYDEVAILMMEVPDDDALSPRQHRRRHDRRRSPNLLNFTFNPSTDSLIDLDADATPASHRRASRRRGGRCTYRDPMQELRDEEDEEDEVEIYGFDEPEVFQISEAGSARLLNEGIWLQEGLDHFGNEGLFERERGDHW